MPLQDLINSAATANGLSPDLLARIVKIESGNNPYARTGSYHGLLQLSQPEFQRYNPTGDIYDPAANLNAGAKKLAGEIGAFRRAYGREPSPTDIYMTHQQGQGGYAAHSANPEGAAWRNMYSTAEGQQKGENWAKAAIWGNIPDNIKPLFPGGVNSVTSRDFTNIWRNKVEGPNAPPIQPTAYGAGDSPAIGTPPIAPQGPAFAPQGQAVASAPAPGPSGLLGMITSALGITPKPQPAAGVTGIPAQAPQAASQLTQPYQPPPLPPLQLPDENLLSFAGQQPMRLTPPPRVQFGRGFY